jgi:TPR repeat protein
MMRPLIGVVYAVILANSVAHAQLISEFDQLLARATAGDAKAQWEVATAYDSGRGVPRDGAEAKRWYRMAADSGLAEAQNSLGSALQAEKYYTEARAWYEKAAAQNHALATNNLAYLHDIGLGVTQDRQKAFELYSRAADLGWAEAMWNNSVMYGAGQLGGPPDLQNACIWSFRAQRFADGNRKLLANVDHVTPMLEHKLSKEQMAKCREQAQSWTPSAIASASDLTR